MPISLKEGAVLVADSHYSTKNPQFLKLLQDISDKKIKTSQLILLGDIFDLLIGGIKETMEENQEALQLLNKLSDDLEIYYLEGNHDFNLKPFFPNMKIISIENQPFTMESNGKKIDLFHGDKDSGFLHLLFTIFIRNRFLLQLINICTLNFVNGNYVRNKIEFLKNKKICSEIKNFQKIIEKKYSKYHTDSDIIVEGHYHQGVSFYIGSKKYVNVKSFACNRSYIVVEYINNGIEFKSITL